MNENNYRGTGKSKAECQAGVDKAIEQWKIDHPNLPVPSSLKNWVENIATDDDVRVARERMKLPHIAAEIKRLEEEK